MIRLKHVFSCRNCGQLVQLLASGKCPLCWYKNR